LKSLEAEAEVRTPYRVAPPPRAARYQENGMTKTHGKMKRDETNLSAAQSSYAPRRMMTGDHSWARTEGTHITGRAHVDGADETAIEMEAKWGCDRLRLLVSPELREKFDRQRYLHNQAIWHGDLEQVKRECGRMVKAWLALDAAATAAGKLPLDPKVWEVVLEDGTVAAIVPDMAHGKAAVTDGRAMAIFTIEEIGKVLSDYRKIAKAKLEMPGLTVTKITRSVDDPLDAISDTANSLNDPIDDVFP